MHAMNNKPSWFICVLQLKYLPEREKSLPFVFFSAILYYIIIDIHLCHHKIIFPVSTRVDITVYQHGKCLIFQLIFVHSWA